MNMWTITYYNFNYLFYLKFFQYWEIALKKCEMKISSPDIHILYGVNVDYKKVTVIVRSLL